MTKINAVIFGAIMVVIGAGGIWASDHEDDGPLEVLGIALVLLGLFAIAVGVS